MTRIVFATPTLKPVGGVVKVFDYARHALDLGHEVVVSCPEPFDSDLPLFGIERFQEVTPDHGVRFVEGFRFGVAPDDLVVFSWPTHHGEILLRLDDRTPLHRVIHLVQNVRHANPTWLDGHAVRLLSRPMSRIMISPQVREACAPLLDPRWPVATILEAHDTAPFTHRRAGGFHDPVRVAYTTWKSKVGVAIEQRLGASDHYEFRSIRSTVGWDELAELYRWADIFLGTPGPEEGFYLPGLEAMAAGAVVVISDAVGNRAYCRFGENCVLVPLDDVDAYVAAIEELRDARVPVIESYRSSGYATLAAHGLDRERAEFEAFLSVVEHFEL